MIFSKFQSTRLLGLRRVGAENCFNPRPTFLLGDAIVFVQARAELHVSIRARPFGQAMRQGQ